MKANFKKLISVVAIMISVLCVGLTGIFVTSPVEAKIIIKSGNYASTATYYVTFYTDDGQYIGYDTCKYGGSVDAPVPPEREGYKFKGWDKSLSDIRSNMRITALYEKEQDDKPVVPETKYYTVLFKSDSNVLSSQQVQAGFSATAPEIPVKPGYTFNGWDKGFSRITSDTTVNALWSAKTYRVYFMVDGLTYKSQTVKYGESAVPPAVSKYGYEFKGWDKDYSNITEDTNVNAVFEEIQKPTEPVTEPTQPTEEPEKPTDPVKPEPEPEPVTYYTVTFTDGLGKTLKSESVESGKSATAPANPTRTGYNFSKWDKSFSKITANTTINAVWTAKNYTVKFVDGQGKTLSTQTIAYSKAAKAPADPTRDGYDFAGWDKSFNKITGNLTVTAKWIPKTYTVKFVSDNKEVSTQTVQYGASATAPSVSKTGYTFAKWDKSYDNITSDTTINAIWNINKYTVKFVSDGKTLNTQTVEYNKAATAPANPIKTGYTFTGWDKSFNKITANTTITAKWDANDYTVKFVSDGDTITTKTVAYGGGVSAPANPTKTGYTFAGWDKTFNKITSDTTVTAKWTAKTIKVIFHYNADTDKTYTENYTYDAKSNQFGMKLTDKSGDFGVWTRKGYTLQGWAGEKQADKAEWKIYSGVANSWINSFSPEKHIYAIWKINSYKVKFVSDGKTLKEQTVEYGESATAPATPTKSGYSFAGWDKSFSNITGDLTVTAKWTQIKVTPKYLVTFTDGQGGSISTIEVESGKSATAPANPTRTGFSFAGWNKLFDKITADTVIDATWKANTYTVTFVDGQGKTLKTQTVEYGKAATAPANPTRTGYTFDGWDKAFTNIKANLTVTAKWKEAAVKSAYTDTTLADGWYNLKSAKDANIYMDSGGGAGSDLYPYTSCEAINYREYISYKIKNTSGGYFKIYSGMYKQNYLLTSQGAGKDVKFATDANNDSQVWKAVKFGSNLGFINKSTGEALTFKTLTASGAGTATRLRTASATGTNEQIFTVSSTHEAPVRLEAGDLSNKYYTISPRDNSATFFDVPNNVRMSGPQIQLCHNTGADAQLYKFTHLGDNIFKIETGVNNGWTALDVANGANNGNLLSWEYSGGNNQKWYIYKYSDGSYAFRNVANRQMIDMPNGTNTGGTKLRTWVMNHSAAQRFKLTQTTKTPSWTGRYETYDNIKRYFPAGGGKYYTGWHDNLPASGWHYFESNGKETTGWRYFTKADGETASHYSYFDGNGVMYESKWFTQVDKNVLSYKNLRYADSRGWVVSTEWDTDGKFTPTGSRASYYVNWGGGIYKVLYENYTQVNQRAYYNGGTNYGMACGPASILMAGMMTTGNGFNYTGTNTAFINYLTNIWGGARVGITGSSGTGLAANNSAAKALGMTSKGWIMSDTRSTVFNETNLVKNLFTGYVLETLGYYPLYGSSGAEHFIVINGVEINSSGQARIHTVDPYG